MLNHSHAPIYFMCITFCNYVASGVPYAHYVCKMHLRVVLKRYVGKVPGTPFVLSGSCSLHVDTLINFSFL